MLTQHAIRETAESTWGDLVATFPNILPSWQDVNLTIDNAQRRGGAMGRTCDGRPRLRLSSRLVDRIAVDEVVRHEAAHYAAGHAAGHGPLWQAWAVRFGASPERCLAAGMLVAQPAKPGYTVQCRVCKFEKVYTKRSKTLDAVRARPQNFGCPGCPNRGTLWVI